MEQSHDVRLKDNSSAAVTNEVDQCLNAFDKHLESECGCAPGTRAHYLHEARCFLVEVFPDLKINWEGLNADHVAGFVLRRAEKLSRLSQQGPVTAIRSLLRFLTFEGQIRAGLEGAVPPLRGSRHASIPRHLSPEQLEANRSGTAGRRLRQAGASWGDCLQSSRRSGRPAAKRADYY